MRSRQWWSFLVLVFSLAALSFAAYTVAAFGHSRATQTPSEIPQPANWVPFSADVSVTHADSGITVYGRFYRDAQGSTRLETGPKGETVVTFIRNIPRGVYYSLNTKRGEAWLQGPMKLPSGGWKPRVTRSDLVGLSKHTPFVEVRTGKPHSFRAATGLTAYRILNGAGTLSLEVPDLSFFPILTVTLEGRREAYSNVEISDQPEHLFLPPAGAQVIVTDQVGGIVHERTNPALKEHVDNVLAGRPH